MTNHAWTCTILRADDTMYDVVVLAPYAEKAAVLIQNRLAGSTDELAEVGSAACC